MSNWGEWTFSPDIKDKIDEFCTIINQKHNDANASAEWMNLHDLISNKAVNKSEEINDAVNSASSTDDVEEGEIVNLLLQAVQFNTFLPESDLLFISITLLSSIFHTFQQKINEQEFLNFCKIIISWKNQVLLDECFSCVILPKLQGKNESSLCTLSSLKDLAKIMPDKVCNRILVPLLTDKENKFKDPELLNSIFPKLPDANKDSLIMAFVKKNNFKENDWLTLQPLVSDLTVTSIRLIIKVMSQYADEFSSNQIFAKFLVAVCKNPQCVAHKDQLYQIIEKNKTLLKRQALRFLDSL